jgi:drug/metabolite transporter (DMT)-like permease
MILAMLVFASQDALSRHLVAVSNPVTVIWIRYCFLILFVVVLASCQPGGLATIIQTRHPILQSLRGVLVIIQLAMLIWAFVEIGLVETHALFAVYPLIVVALSALFLGEHIGWLSRLAVIAGFLGVLFMLELGSGFLTAKALIVLLAAVIFAVYAVLTRYVARSDPPMTSFLHMGLAGLVAVSLVGPFHWAPPPRSDWGWMAVLCVMGALAHYLLIRAYGIAQASARL